MVKGQYAHLTVEQFWIDVVIVVSGPLGEVIATVDRPSGAFGREGVSLKADASGDYRIELQSLEKKAARGRYRITLHETRDAVPSDEARIAAEQSVTEGEELRALGTAESRRQAIERFMQALVYWRELNEAYEQAVVLYGIGLTYRSLGDNPEAITSFSQSLALMKQVGEQYGQAVAQTGLAWTYLYLGDYRRSLRSFSETLRVRRTLGDRRGEGLALFGIGWAHLLLNDTEKALDCFMRSLAIRKEVNDRRGEALTLTGIGKLHSRTGNHIEALSYLEHALRILNETRNSYGEADVLSEIGWVSYKLGQYPEALRRFNEALQLRREAGDRTGEATTLYGIACVADRLGNLSEARARIEASLGIIESLRSRISSPQLRMSYLAQVPEYYEFYIDLLMRLDRLHPTKGFAALALQASERARARSLLELLAEARIDIRRDVDVKLLERERALQIKLNEAAERQRRLLTGQYTGEQSRAAAAEVDSLAGEYQEVLEEIRRNSPQYASLAHPLPLNASDIQRVLDRETILLEYALGEQRSYLFLVSTETVKGYELPARSKIEEAVRRIRELLTARNRHLKNETTAQRRARVARADTSYWKEARALSRMLLEPAADELGQKRLLIVAEGALQYVPFGALPSPRTGRPLPLENLLPLIVDHEIVMVPSASTLAALRKETAKRSTAPKVVAVLADPVFTPEDERVKGNGKTSPSPRRVPALATERAEFDLAEGSPARPLPRLFGTRLEAQQIVSLVPAEQSLLALDFAAHRSLATSSELGQFQILHFATHAIINDTHPELSGVAMSLVDEQGKHQDGFLRAHELYRMKLPVELVVLSACQTGLGKDVRGEGMLGLTRGFLYAGAKRVVVSLWSLNDKVTAELMSRFYGRMLGPARKSALAALRAAQIEMMKDRRWQSPYFWAAFALQGEWQQ